MRIDLIVNDAPVYWEGDPAARLLDVLRDDLGLTGVKCGCREGECGACSVLLDGRLANSCLVAMGQARGRRVVSIEGYRGSKRFAALDRAFAAHGAVQCGYCTPGMVLASEALLSGNPRPTEAQVRAGIAGNLCRCTGYNAIVAAILDASREGIWEAAHACAGDAGVCDTGVCDTGVCDTTGSDAEDKRAVGALPDTPHTLAEALELMARGEFTPYAGGTDLMVKDSPGQTKAQGSGRRFLFLQGIEELRQIREDGQYLRIGAAVTYAQLLASDLTPAILREAVAQIAAPGIRNVATLGGNIANASPKGDGALVCFVTDCQLRLAHIQDGTIIERTVPIASFYRGRGLTILEPGELLIEILMPKTWLAGYGLCKVGGRRALAISRISFAGLFCSENGVVKHLALAFGAVEDTVVRKPQLDQMLVGKTLDEARKLVGPLLEAYGQAIHPVQGRVSATYRLQVCLNLAADFLATHLS